jgi:hypothetical protein
MKRKVAKSDPNPPVTEEKPLGPIYTEYWPLSKILRWPRNPKLHDLDEIGASMDRFGYTLPALIDERSGRLVAGHGRADKLQQKKDKGEPPPERIIEQAGEWWMPVTRGVKFKNDAEAEAYLLADNKLTLGGGFHQQTLAEILQDLSRTSEGFKGTGYTGDDLQTLLSVWGRTEVVQFTAFVDPQPPTMLWRVVVPGLTEMKARRLAKQLDGALVEQYREK